MRAPPCGLCPSIRLSMSGRAARRKAACAPSPARLRCATGRTARSSFQTWWTDGTPCSNEVFGDPTYGTVKDLRDQGYGCTAGLDVLRGGRWRVRLQWHDGSIQMPSWRRFFGFVGMNPMHRDNTRLLDVNIC